MDGKLCGHGIVSLEFVRHCDAFPIRLLGLGRGGGRGLGERGEEQQ